ncbi:tripartite tricarboxylate transporter substrate binding protein [Achromobacter sp. MFA1 R4]|uniref:Bug family tripartite tricarboxylate transporter substrate binding protein n=1 Tax=Achromobacter sp. MFA1 R4 TaxID=1881016 RepID=UPI0009538CF0|nr:tripartite tricarboxylate transporter substrate binding protein [Achromobacter sp. MFA1 R4]SIT30477.1 Tripartite-type tricarboxylate transporter, receptor component TctC [Achromobacter sp. MFA1 R4]
MKPLRLLPLTLALCAGAAAAQYPDHPVRVVVGFSPGGPTDVVARAFASYASQALGQTFVVENRPGANTILAAEAVAKAAPDGYTLLIGATNHTMIPALYADRVKFDALKSFTPICAVAVSPTVLVTGPALKVNTLDDFLARARAEPGRLTYATPGTGSSGHFATAQFLQQTGIRMNHIPYKGAAQAISDLMGGQVDSSLATLGSVLPQVQSGKLTALAVAAPKRLAQLPQVPTFDEAGVPGYAADAWYGVLAPAGLPPDVRARLQETARGFARADATAKSLDALGMQPRELCGDAFGAQLSHDIDTNRKLAQELGLKAE